MTITELQDKYDIFRRRPTAHDLMCLNQINNPEEFHRDYEWSSAEGWHLPHVVQVEELHEFSGYE